MFGDNPFSLCLFGQAPDGSCLPDPPKADKGAWYLSPYVGVVGFVAVVGILFLALKPEAKR